jgi:hypothetical protein
MTALLLTIEFIVLLVATALIFWDTDGDFEIVWPLIPIWGVLTIVTYYATPWIGPAILLLFAVIAVWFVGCMIVPVIEWSTRKMEIINAIIQEAKQ